MRIKLPTLFIFYCFFTATFAFASSIHTNLSEDKIKKATLDERPKYRIGFDAPQITHRQLLLTIDPNTTDGVDWGYDGEIPQVLPDDMYWLINNTKYVIQGINSVSANKEISLGVVTTNGGNITIKIDALEYPIAGLIVGLKDADLNVIYNLEESDYQINLPAGEYHNRFSIIFLSAAPDTETGTDVGTDTDTETGTDVGTDTDTETGTDTENGTDSGTETETDTETGNEDEDTEEEHHFDNDHRNNGNHFGNHHRNNGNHFGQQKIDIYVNGLHSLIIKNKELCTINKVSIFNKYGTPIKNWNKNLSSENITLSLQLKSDIYIVIVETQNGPVFKRIMN